MGVTAAITAGVQIYGQYKANQAEAKAQKANAAYLREQKEFQEMITRREVDIFKDESTEFMGQKVSAIAASGIALSGSALAGVGEDKASIARETAAIAMGGENKSRFIGMRAAAADAAGAYAGSSQKQFLDSAGIGLNAYANYSMANTANKKTPPLKSPSSSWGITPDGGFSGPLRKGN